MLELRNILNAIFVRILLLLHSLLTVWRAADVQNNNFYWLLGLTNVLLIAETIYVVIRRKGQERKWFCPCFLLYLFGTLPAIWFLELDKLERYEEAASSSNVTEAQSVALSSTFGVSLPITLEPDIWVSLLEQSLIFLLIIGRWLLPRGELTRHQLSQLLFVYIGAGSDILEFFIVFEESEVRSNRILSYISLAVWSASLLQFTMVLTATKSPKKGRFVMDNPDQETKTNNFCEKLMVTEIWSLIVSTMLLDFPFLCIRLYILIILKILSYGILFFTCKNIVLILVVIYRIYIVCVDSITDNDDDDDDDEEKMRNNKVEPSPTKEGGDISDI